MKIFFRADANDNIGYGHFVRSLALASVLKDKFECVFFTLNPTKYQLSEISKVCKYIPLPNDHTHFNYFLSILDGNEIVVLDNYYYSTSYQQEIQKKGSTLVCIDDIHDKYYVADVVINHVLSDKSLFSVETYTKLCLGFDWLLLRRPFLKSIHQERKKASLISRVVVCFGGVDTNDFTGKLIKYLEEVPSINSIVAIVGDKYSPVEKGIFKKVDYKRNLSAEEIVSVFTSVDYAFLSASTICLEALTCHLPIAAGYYVENQIGLYGELSSGGYIYPLGSLFEVNWKNIIEDIISSKREYIQLNRKLNVEENYLSLFNRLSLKHYFEQDNLIFINYYNLTKEQSCVVWSTRIEEDVRKWMDNPDFFSFEQHCNFVNSLKVVKNKIYWAVFKDEIFVGSVNISMQDGSLEVERGIFVCPNSLEKSLGTIIEIATQNLLKEMGVKRILAKVLKENLRSLKFHYKNAYLLDKEDNRYYYLSKEI